jgi:hypothetical protein
VTANVFPHARKLGFEGIVSKRLGSLYRSGRSNDWLKFKNAAAPAVRRDKEEDWAASGGDDRARTKDRRKTALRPKISQSSALGARCIIEPEANRAGILIPCHRIAFHAAGLSARAVCRSAWPHHGKACLSV